MVHTEARLDRPALPAFTLIEIVMVILIITLLISLILPGLGGARASSRDMKCRSNLKQVHIAQELHAVDTGRFMPLWTEASAIGWK